MKYVYRTNHIWASNFIAINLDSWNAISPANQEIMLGLATEYEPQFWDASTNLGNAALQTLVDNGMEIVDMPAGMLEEMQARTRPAIDRYIEEVPTAP